MQIGDFGLSKLTTTQFAETIVGTPFYMAPEIHQGKPYSFSSDVWSLGVVVYYMCTYTMPFNARTALELEEKVFVPLGPSLTPFLTLHGSFGHFAWSLVRSFQSFVCGWACIDNDDDADG